MKIILAVGSTQVEDILIASLPQTCKVVGIAPYREAVLTKLEEVPSTDVLLIRDNLKGSLPILKLIHQVRSNYPHCRIILMTKQREAGDPFLSEVVSFGIWDIIVGSKSTVSMMIDYITTPRTFKDVERYQIRKMLSEKEIAEGVKTESSTPVETPIPSHASSTPQHVSAQDETPTPKMSHSSEDELVFQLDETEHFDLTPDSVSTTEELGLANPKEQDSLQGKRSMKRLRSETTETMKQPTVVPSPPVVPIPAPTPPLLTPTEPTPKAESLVGKMLKPTKPKPTLSERTESKKAKPSKRRAFETEIKNSPVVMSLVGSRGGVGTTQTAFNLAINLATHKNRVLYVELNDAGLPFTYLYQLGNLNHGLEAALEMTASTSLQDVSSYVNRMKQLKRSNDKTLASIASKYPDSLDFLAFSQFFKRDTHPAYHPECLKELLMGLLLTEGYQYIILDLNLRSDERLIHQALSCSRYIVPVMTQNVLTIGETIDQLETIHSNALDLNHKVYFLINRYNSNLLKERAILKWANNELPFKVQNVWTIPNEPTMYQSADDKSYPALLCGAPKNLIQAFETLHNYLKTM